MKRKSNSLPRYFVIAFLAIFLYMAFVEETEDSATRHVKKPVAEKQSKTRSKQARKQSAKGPVVWPPSTDQAIEMADNPLATNYLVVFDGSGSMMHQQCSGKRSKEEVAKEAVKKFASKISEEDALGLLVFDEKNPVKLLAPLRTGDRGYFMEAVDKIKVGGVTPLTRSLVRGQEILEKQAQAQGGYGAYHLVVITDGASSDGDPKNNARKIINSTMIQIHVIGFCVGSGHSLNIPGYTLYTTADNPQKLTEGLQAVLAESEEFDSTEFIVR